MRPGAVCVVLVAAALLCAGARAQELSDITMVSEAGLEVITNGDVKRSWEQGTREFSGTDAAMLLFLWSSPSGTEVSIGFSSSETLVVDEPVAVGYGGDRGDEDFRQTVPVSLAMMAVLHPCKQDGETTIEMTITPASVLLTEMVVRYKVICALVASTFQMVDTRTDLPLVLNGIVQVSDEVVAPSGGDLVVDMATPISEVTFQFFTLRTYDESTIVSPTVSVTSGTVDSTGTEVRLTHTCKGGASRTWIVGSIDLFFSGSQRQATAFAYVLQCDSSSSDETAIVVSLVVVIVALVAICVFVYLRIQRKKNSKVVVDKLDGLVVG